MGCPTMILSGVVHPFWSSDGIKDEVLEENCDSSSMYYLCQEDMKKDVEAISCVHKKRETIGMFCNDC